MASLRELWDRWMPEEADKIAHVTPNGLTVVDTQKLFRRPDVRNLFKSMKEKKTSSRQVVITGKK